MKQFSLFVFLLVLQLSLSLSAQNIFKEGAIYANNKVEKGLVTIKNQNVYLGENKNDQRAIPLKEIDSVVLNGSRYVTAYLYEKGSAIIGRLVIENEFQLLELNERYFIAKEDTAYSMLSERREVEIKGYLNVPETKSTSGNQYKQLLSYLMSDCSSITSKIESTRLGENSLINLIEYYSECTGSPVMYRSSQKKLLTIKFELMGGYGFSSLDFEASSLAEQYIDQAEFSSYQRPDITLMSEWYLTGKESLLNLVFGVKIANYESLTASTISDRLSSTVNEISVSYLQRAVPIGLNYHFNPQRKPNYLFFGAGVQYNLLSNFSLTRKYYPEDNPTNFTIDNNPYRLKTSNIGGWIQIGYLFKIGSIPISLRYSASFMGPLINDVQTINNDKFDSSSNSHTLQIGIQLFEIN